MKIYNMKILQIYKLRFELLKVNKLPENWAAMQSKKCGKGQGLNVFSTEISDISSPNNQLS
jgi:hypothetical protein